MLHLYYVGRAINEFCIVWTEYLDKPWPSSSYWTIANKLHEAQIELKKSASDQISFGFGFVSDELKTKRLFWFNP